MNSSPKMLLAADSSRIQLELSQKLFSNSTYESLNHTSGLNCIAESPSEMISRRLKHHRHPLSGMRTLLPEMNEHLSSPNFFEADLKTAHKLNSRILETWINNTISDAASLNLPGQVIKQESKLPLMRYGIDRTTLLKAGLQAGDVDRLYRSLFVYSIGFYQLIQKILEHSGQKYSIVTGIWKVYAVLLEYCCQLDYQMIITTLNTEKKEEIEQLEADFQEQISRLELQEKEMQENIESAKSQMNAMQKDLQSEISKREEIEDELMRRGSGHEEEVAMRLQFESKLNQMYAKLRDLQTKIEFLSINLAELQRENEIRSEALAKEKFKNTQLNKVKTETEIEMRKVEEKYKQTENMNSSLEKRISECYNQIEGLSVSLSNLNKKHSETLNELAQAKIEIDDFKFSLEITRSKLSKVEAVVLEQEAEKQILVNRVKDLEFTLAEEVQNNQFYQQEFVKIKESDKLNSSELGKYRARCNEQESSISELIQKRDSLIIQLDSMTTLANELKLNLKDVQNKLEEMNKGRRMVEEANVLLKQRIEEKTRETKEMRSQIISLKEEQERFKNKEAELDNEINDLRIKLQSVQKQFQTTKETLEEKISNLYEILESEKKIRENWIYRFEDEQRSHANDTKELILTHDKLNEATIKINNLQAYLEESNFQRTKLGDSHKSDLEEILSLKFMNEDLNRKNRTLQNLIENIDNEYRLREAELNKEHEKLVEGLNQLLDNSKMKLEEIWVQALKNLERFQEITIENKKINYTLAEDGKKISDLASRLEKRSQEYEGRGLLLEDSRSFIIRQYDNAVTLKTEIKNLEVDLKKSRKELNDFRNLAPPELRNVPNPFRILMTQISDLMLKIEDIENYKIDTKDFAMQWDEPLPVTFDEEIQTDPIKFEPIREKAPSTYNYSRQASIKSSKRSSKESQRHFKDSERSSSNYLNLTIGKKSSQNPKEFETEEFEDEKIQEATLHRDDDRITPLNLKSIYAKEISQEAGDAPGKSPNKLPHINNYKRTQQASPVIHTPTPIPTLPSTDFKRALKQAVSRRINDE